MLWRGALLLVLGVWLLPVAWVFWPTLELNQFFAHRVAPARNALYRLEDGPRRWLSGFSLPDTLPVLRLTLPDAAEDQLRAQLDTIRARGINVAGKRAWADGQLRIGTEGTDEDDHAPALPARVTWHGKFQNHWLGRQRSLKVKLASGTWWGLRAFSLLTPDNRDLFGLPLANALADAAGIWHPRARLVRVEVNAADWGLYYVEEPLDRAFLTRNGLPGGVWLAPRAAWADDFPDHRRAVPYGQHVGLGRGAHTHALSLDPAFQEVEAPDDSTGAALAARALGAWARVRDLTRLTDPLPDSAAVAALLDVQAWGAADALRHLLADQHNLAGDNLHVVFDPATGRFRPVYRFEGGITWAERTDGLTNAATLRYNGHPLPLWALVNRQPTLRWAKLRALHRLTASAAPVAAALRATEPTTRLVTRAAGSEFPIRQRRWKAAKIQQAVVANRGLLHQSLTRDAWLYAQARISNSELVVELLPEAEGALEVMAVVADGRMLPLPSPRRLLTRLGPLESPGSPEALLRTVDTLRLPWPTGTPAPRRLTLRARNALTGQALAPDRVRVVVAD